MFLVNGFRNQNKMPVEKHLFRLLDSLLRSPGEMACSIDIEQGHIIEGHLVKEDDEFHKVRVGLLPEGFFPFAEQVVQE